MKPEHAERLFVEELVSSSIRSFKIPHGPIKNVDKLTGDASTRRYYRVLVSEVSYVVCIDDPKSHNQEHPFLVLQKVLLENGVTVPDVLDVDLSKGYILEEDLGDQTMLTRLAEIRSVDEERSLYEASLDQMTK